MSLLSGIRFSSKDERKSSSSHHHHHKRKREHKEKSDSKRHSGALDLSEADLSSDDEIYSSNLSEKMKREKHSGSSISRDKGDIIESEEISDSSSKNRNIAGLLRSQLKQKQKVLCIEERSDDNIPSHTISGRIRASKNGETSLHAEAIREKYDRNNMDDIFAQNVVRLGKHFTGKEFSKTKGSASGFDEDDEISSSLFEESHEDQDRNTAKAIARSIRQENSLSRAMASCHECLNNFSCDDQKYLLFKGTTVYLRLKKGNLRLNPFHCELIPIEHVSCLRNCDEDVLIEINRVKSLLRRLAERNRLSMVFLENAVHLRRGTHAILDCVPLPVGQEQDLRISYHHALMTHASDWSQNKKLIELKKSKLLSQTIPRDFEYVSLEWGDDSSSPNYGGILHLIDSSTKEVSGFDEWFGLDIVAGMLEEDSMRWRLKRKARIEEDGQLAQQFRKEWTSVDQNNAKGL